MDKQQAQTIIKETFEKSFNRDRFNEFIKNLLNKIENAPFSYQGNYIPDAYKPFVSRYERIGKYNDGEKRIDILIVYLNRKTSIERARTSQRNFIAGYLDGKYGSDVSKDAALVAFVSPNEEDWRFSLVKMDYRFEPAKDGKVKVKEEFTPARRWSFLVGENESSHTAQSRLVPRLADDEYNPTLTQMEEAFSIEKVTKEFFEKYRDLFLWTKETLDKIVEQSAKIKADFEKKGVNTVDFAKKLLGQIVFLYFLQKKGWFGVKRDAEWGTGTKKFLKELFQGKYGQYGNFFNDILEPLFYEALRMDRRHDDNYYSRFNCKIPFLNGGLFDPIGGYDWVHTDIFLPNELFSNQNKTKEGDTGNGILDIFDRYNFTVKEDEPLEKEVAVDPEMLGKVFENLLEVKNRKSKGSYYTPREIVHYMCQQSLIAYLGTELNKGVTLYQDIGDMQINAFGNEEKVGQLDLTVKDKSGPEITKKDIETLIKYSEQFGENEATVEARGKETDTYSYKLSENIRRNAKLIDGKLASIKICDPAIGSGAFPVGMMHEIVRVRDVLSTFIKGPDRTAYHFKRECIEKSLYGVDIDPGAVEIAKLRLWLSLVVDEADIKQIKPLPNLDYKIVCGNSLLGIKEDLFSHQSFNKLEKIKPFYFNETNARKKQEYKNQIDELISQITHGHKDFDFEIYFSEVFHEKKGFDVVIGNPPYVEHKKLKEFSSFFEKNFLTYSGTADLYVYFYETGLNILKDSGLLTFISSNKFIKTKYGRKLRELLARNKLYQLIDFTKIHVFNALVASCIIMISKTKQGNNVIVSFVDNSMFKFRDLSEFIKKHYIKLASENLSDKVWQLEDKNKIALKSKIEKNNKKLRNVIGVKISRGITTGHNPAFIIDGKLRDELIEKDCKNKELVKPLLQGRNIRRWHYTKSNTFLISTGYDIDIRKEYPKVFESLKKFESKLKTRADQGVNWWNLRACTYYSQFDQEKIIWGLTADKWAFAYDNQGYYLPSNGYILTSSGNLATEYILALLNCNLLQFYFRFVGIITAGGAYTLKHETIGSLPIKEIRKTDQQPFVTLVDRILAITKDEDYLQNSQKQSQVKALEREIDQMVYQLYSLTEKEIRTVEGDK